MNIEGLSEATLEKLIGRGWIHSYLDLYRLDQHRDEIIRMEGFGASPGSVCGMLSSRAATPPLNGM